MRICTRIFVAVTLLSSAALCGESRAVFAGGCFWGVEAVFEQVKGVIDVRSGYSGGTKASATYDEVSAGRTKHAEAVEIRFDPARISYEKLLNIFFVVAHDPTEVNRQGPDIGPQYRSAVFFINESQRRSARAFIDALTTAKAYKMPIATEVVRLSGFYPAENYHQDYLRRNPDDPYIVRHDLPKLEALKKKFPDLIKPGKVSKTSKD